MRIPAWTGLAILILWGLSYGSVRTYLFWKEVQIESRIAQSLFTLPTESLFLFAITKKDSARRFHWEHEMEFSYQNQMFDVVRRETRGDSLFLWCYWDEEETALKDIEHAGFQPNGQDPSDNHTYLLARAFLQALMIPRLSWPQPPGEGVETLHNLGYWPMTGSDYQYAPFQPPDLI